MQTYDLGRHGNGPLEIDKQANITCRLCSMTSYHPEDIRQLFCDHCHIFHTQLGDWLKLTLDSRAEVSEAFTDMIARKVMLPEDSQAGLKKLLLLNLHRPTVWERLLDRSI